MKGCASLLIERKSIELILPKVEALVEVGIVVVVVVVEGVAVVGVAVIVAWCTLDLFVLLILVL